MRMRCILLWGDLTPALGEKVGGGRCPSTTVKRNIHVLRRLCVRERKEREEGTCECNGGGMKNEVTWFSLSFEGQGEAPEYSWKGPV